MHEDETIDKSMGEASPHIRGKLVEVTPREANNVKIAHDHKVLSYYMNVILFTANNKRTSGVLHGVVCPA